MVTEIGTDFTFFIHSVGTGKNVRQGSLIYIYDQLFGNVKTSDKIIDFFEEGESDFVAKTLKFAWTSYVYGP